MICRIFLLVAINVFFQLLDFCGLLSVNQFRYARFHFRSFNRKCRIPFIFECHAPGNSIAFAITVTKIDGISLGVVAWKIGIVAVAIEVFLG